MMLPLTHIKELNRTLDINTSQHTAAGAFVPYLQAVGRGQRSGRSLTQAEAFDAMTMLLENRITREQRGAFLMLLRVREETAEEIAGFTQACRTTLPNALTQHADQADSKTVIDLDIGAYAGKRRQLPWFLLAVACLVEQGVKVGMHGTQEPESQRLYIQSVLSQLSASIRAKNTLLKTQESEWQATSIVNIEAKIKQRGFVYADLSLLHPQLDELIQLREVFGLRSCANTLARLLNPFNASYSFQGVHHKHVDDKHAEVARLLDEQNILCFRGEGGEPEVDPSKETILKVCRHGNIEHINLIPEQRWELKPKALDVNTLALVWQGAKMHSYGENTVISSLAALLILLENKTQDQAFSEAKKLWKARNGTRFLGVDAHFSSSFDVI
ncbi:MAG: anthranilate phosphoribosyltransferase [Gammaproteobacteria bacterium]|jgi:anthranilate phosphoribosyltransferase